MAMVGKRIHPQAYDALCEALTHFYWYKQDLAGLLITLTSEHPELLAGLEPRTAMKRETASLLTSRLRGNEEKYRQLTLQSLVTLAGFDETFPHLAQLDDGPLKVAPARAALERIRAATEDYRADLDAVQARAAELRSASAQDAQRRTSSAKLAELRERFLVLSRSTDPQTRGLSLEPLLRDLFLLFDLDPRAAFALAHEQIDGAFTFDTDDYLLEARWRRQPVDPQQVRAFEAKVAAKAHRSGGLMLSVNGFTSGAIDVLQGRGSWLLLMDGADLMAVLEGRISLVELLLRKRRHAAETGEPWLSASAMLT
jgi:hypothetical protein